MKRQQDLRILLFGVVLLSYATYFGQEPVLKPTVRGNYEAGLAARQKGDSESAAAEFRKSIEEDHSFILGHIGYIDAVFSAKRAQVRAKNGAARDLTKALIPLQSLYAKWVKQDPSLYGVAILAYALQQDPVTKGDNVAHELSAACSINSEIESYLIAAAEAELKDDPERALVYARGFRAADPDEYVRTLREITERFPQRLVSMRAAYYLAEQEETLLEKTAILERIRTDFADVVKQDQSALTSEDNKVATTSFDSSMRDLFGTYLKMNEDIRALELAEQMANEHPDDKAWAATLYFQRSIVRHSRSMSADKGMSADKILRQTQTQLALLQAKRGDLKAYESLSNAVAQSPVEPLKSALYKLGSKLGKPPERIDSEIWQLQTRGAPQFKDFELETFDGTKVKLRDLRGKVVMISFWFPTCEGCVTEFPYFERIVQKYKSSNKFIFLAINSRPSQDHLVQALLVRRKLTFNSLKVSETNWTKENYGIRSWPSNFLLDSEGRIIYEGFMVHTPEELEELEDKIEWLIGRIDATSRVDTPAVITWPNPVSLSVKSNPASKVRADDKLTVELVAAIEPDWHIYSTVQSTGGPIATSISLPEGQPFALAGKIQESTPTTKLDPNFGIETKLLSGPATFSLPLRVKPDTQPGKHKLEVSVTFQACTETTCLPPKTVKLETEIEVAGTIMGGRSVNQPKTANALAESKPSTQTPAIAPSAANSAVDFTFTDFAGKSHKLSEFRGKFVLLDFWATWCLPCLKDIPKLKTLYEKYKGNGFEIIGMDSETIGDEAESPDPEFAKETDQRARKIVSERGVTWPQATSETAVPIAVKVFGVKSLPTKILIDREGRIVATIGEKDDLEGIIKKHLSATK